MRIRLLRDLYVKGALVTAGETVELRDDYAREAIYLGRAEPESPDDVRRPAGPLTTESAPELVSGKARKGKTDARE